MLAAHAAVHAKLRGRIRAAFEARRSIRFNGTILMVSQLTSIGWIFCHGPPSMPPTGSLAISWASLSHGLQRKLYRKAKAEPAYRFYLLYDKICREDILANVLVASDRRGDRLPVSEEIITNCPGS